MLILGGWGELPDKPVTPARFPLCCFAGGHCRRWQRRGKENQGPRDPDGNNRIFYVPIDNQVQQYVREYDRKILQKGAKKSFQSTE